MVTDIVQHALSKPSKLVFSKVAYPVCAYCPECLDKATDSVLLVRMNPRDILAYLMFLRPAISAQVFLGFPVSKSED
jgi:hypothetical protein